MTNMRFQKFSNRVRHFGMSRACIALPLAMYSIYGIAQVPALSPAPAGATASSVNALRPALQQVNIVVTQINVDRWKLPRERKQEFSDDAASIHQDLSGPLPGLLQAAQQSPAAVGPQLAVMHNVDALYDVLVRLATAADICGGKSDAAQLDSVLQNLEAARKTAATQVMQAASTQDQKLARLQSQLAPAHAAANSGGDHVIVVDNRVRPTTHHHKSSHAATAPPSNSTTH